MIKKIIDKTKKISIEKLIFFSIMIILIGIPTIVLYTYLCYYLESSNLIMINRAHLLWWAIPVLFMLYVLDLLIYKKKITYIDVLVYLLIILGVISTILAVDVRTSVFGAAKRNEGLLSLLSYYFIMLNIKNMSNEKYKNIIIKTIISIGIVKIIYSLLQVYTNLPFIIRYPNSYIASGLCGHNNFLGSYMIILASFTFSMYMLEEKKKYLILSTIFFMGICLCSSTGPFFSFLLLIIFFVIFYRKKIKWKNLFKIVSLFVFIYFFVAVSVRLVQNNIFHKNVKSNYYMSSMISDFSSSNLGNGRVELWKNSMPLLKKYWAFGAGIDNFGKVYEVKSDNLHFDKAHNVYLQIAITNGVFALIVYLVLMAIIFFRGLKLKEKKYISMLMAFIAYCIQAFANISVVEVAPTFFVVCGFLLERIQKDRIRNN